MIKKFYKITTIVVSLFIHNMSIKSEFKKIAFVGAHSTGKTTIVSKLHNKHKDSLALYEVFRDTSKVFALNGLTKKDDLKSVYYTFARQLELELSESVKNKTLFTDRSIFDCFIYADIINDNILKENAEYQLLKSFARKYIATYYKVYIIIPSDKPLIQDNFRDTNKELQMKIHNAFVEELKMLPNVKIMSIDDIYKEFNL